MNDAHPLASWNRNLRTEVSQQLEFDANLCST